MLDLDSLRRIEDRDQRYRAALEIFTKAKLDAGARVEMELEGNGIDFPYAAEVMGTSVAEFRRQLDKGVRFKPHLTLRLANILLKESCHQLFFGERGITELPRLESHLTSILLEATPNVKNEVYAMAIHLYSQDRNSGTLYCQNDDSGLVRDRIMELCADRNVQSLYLLGQDECQMSKLCLRKFVTQEEPIYIPQNQVLMYYAFALNTSLDYFMAPDYTQFSDIRLFGSPTNQAVRDAQVIKIIGKFLVLCSESRRALASYILSQYWRSGDCAVS